jgi:hypothetical protein
MLPALPLSPLAAQQPGASATMGPTTGWRIGYGGWQIGRGEPGGLGGRGVCYLEADLAVRLRVNEPEYDADDFVPHRILHLDLHFDDCTAPRRHPPSPRSASPPPSAPARPWRCAARRGWGGRPGGADRALCMVKHHGSAGREAMGWLRIMRPGSVIGEQQHSLCGWPDSDGPASVCDHHGSAGREARASLLPTSHPLSPSMLGLFPRLPCVSASRTRRCAYERRQHSMAA